MFTDRGIVEELELRLGHVRPPIQFTGLATLVVADAGKCLSSNSRSLSFRNRGLQFVCDLRQNSQRCVKWHSPPHSGQVRSCCKRDLSAILVCSLSQYDKGEKISFINSIWLLATMKSSGNSFRLKTRKSELWSMLLF